MNVLLNSAGLNVENLNNLKSDASVQQWEGKICQSQLFRREGMAKSGLADVGITVGDQTNARDKD